MKQNYFMYNGQKYYTGTKIKIKVYNGYGNRPEIAEFINYDTETNKYSFTVNGTMYTYDKRGWSSYFMGVCDNIQSKTQAATQYEPTIKEWTFRKELDVDGMLNAWMWYVLLMGITTIFQGNILYWTVISGIFFKYRDGKLRKAGYKE